MAAYIMFGFPEETPYQEPVINPSKWDRFATHKLKYLGFEIDSQKMTVIWPMDKREKLANMLDQLWFSSDNPVLSPKQISRPLGLIRNGALVSVFGVSFSLQIQYRLTDALIKSLKVTYKKGRPNKPGKRWWRLGKVPIPQDVIADLQILRATLLATEFDHLYNRPISHLIPRDATVQSYDDASYSGLGGYSVNANMMWRLHLQDFLDIGYPMYTSEPTPGTLETGTHINILEFLALIITIWFTIALAGPDTPDFIYVAWSDNTSALSWLRASARARDPIIRRYARFLQTLLAVCPHKISLQGLHVKGIDNEDADLLSRPKRAPTWRSVIEQVSSPVKSCRPYQVPCALLMALLRLRTVEETGDWYVRKTTALWTVEPSTLPNGWLDCASTVQKYEI
jgi:hypothetical protein